MVLGHRLRTKTSEGKRGEGKGRQQGAEGEVGPPM